MSEELKGAFIQRDGETYAIVPNIPLGLLSADTLEKMAQVIRKYDIPITKITSAQRIALVGLKPEQVKQVWEDLNMDVGHAVGLCMHYVQACPGTSVCKYGIQNSLSLGQKLNQEFYGVDFPAKVKIGVSGCPLNCGEGYVKDLGVFGKKDGWTVIFGGNSGGNPSIGDVLKENLTDDEVIELAKKALSYYKENAKKRERTSRFIKRIGIEEFKKNIGI